MNHNNLCYAVRQSLTGSMVAELGISFVAASRAICQLVDAGILTERTGYRRNKLFAAREVLTILNRPLGSAAELPGGAI
ncbi:hypothetical protein [Niveispirillum sp. BGYR6]|uniref:hypothetical protein n=1 Tax=Niveispirillum sp. BGYR6 TaxID=2971249 RepID=UPI0022B9CF31|nr:hypothetical protein [Niveispirillum sp. BGYR6]MDG5494828.1 hypothetical protein [Niveispirillum sp. BGYR6]